MNTQFCNREAQTLLLSLLLLLIVTGYANGGRAVSTVYLSLSKDFDIAFYNTFEEMLMRYRLDE